MSDGLYEQIIQELESSKEDIRPSDAVMFSEPLRSALNFALRVKRFTLAEFAEQLKFTGEQSRQIAVRLVERNFLKILQAPDEQVVHYEVRLTG